LPAPVTGVPRVTTVASLERATWGYSGPHGHRTRRIAPRWLNSPLITPVLTRVPGWVKIRLPMRPNGSTTWVPVNDVLLSTTPYFILINLTTTHLVLYRDGRPVFRAPVGVGLAPDVTPTGNFFVTFYAQAPDPYYGPWLMMTSAHSNVISDWSGTGDALIALHGPLDADAQIGTTGGYVSHGCIRLHLRDQLRLGVVHDGTPIKIVK
jgi:lipoprotein-anchoring transpeptidase ErfK/SrfK